jgi:hypothetical protein
LKNLLHKIPKHLWILLAIIFVGIFLRAYNFHNWLDFGSDQVKDANIVGAVIEGKAPWPSYGPDMGNSGTGGRQNRFRIGPMYYDFEIISAKIFGNNPTSMAYPDLLFSILSIPLFYYFLRKIFGTNLSLALTGLYSISFYSLYFSHSAWNINSIPFFSLLFLLSLYEFIVAKEKTHWGWIVALGIALGVSVQLHAILLVLFPVTLFFACVIFMRKNPQVWKKLGVVIVIMIILNLGQIIGEEQSNFKNSKIFLYSVTGPSIKSDDNLFVRTVSDLNCNFQANSYMLSSIGDGNCNFSLTTAMGHGLDKKILKKIASRRFILEAIICIIFSILGYYLLIYRYIKEENKKRKYFFGLVMLYAVLSFVVMFPVIDADLRYFVHVFFVPFIFLGFVIDFLMQKLSKKYVVMISALLLIFLAASNIFSIYLEVRDEFAQSRIILGQVESMVDYMISNSDSQKNIYLFNDANAGNYFNSLKYIANEKNISLLRAGDKDIIPPEKAKFYLSVGIGSDSATQINGKDFDSYKVFNQVTLFHLTN